MGTWHTIRWRTIAVGAELARPRCNNPENVTGICVGWYHVSKCPSDRRSSVTANQHPEQQPHRQQARRKPSGLSKRLRMLDSSEFKRQTFYALENIRRGNWVARICGVFLFMLILANAVLVFFSAQTGLDPISEDVVASIYVFSTICFFVEYGARIWIADLAFGNCTRFQARLKYIFSPMGIIDLLSFAPNILSWFLPVTQALINAIGVLRLIRLIKVTRYMRGFRTIGRVIRKHYREIVAAFLVIGLLIIVASVVMYEVEHEAQPDQFNSLFQGVWWAVETVTGTGYGDIVPVTTLGKAIGMVIMLLALALVAIPGGIFSAGFVAEYQNADLRKIERGVRSTSHHTEETSNEIKEQDEVRSVK